MMELSWGVSEENQSFTETEGCGETQYRAAGVRGPEVSSGH